MRRVMKSSGLDSDEEMDLKPEAPEPAAEWTEESQERNNIMTTVDSKTLAMQGIK